MLVLTSWLKDFVPFTVPAETLAEDLTMTGLEVEGVEYRYDYLKSVVVGKITAILSHDQKPDLKICTVDTGKKSLQVVCGAPNVKIDQFVAVALPGTVLPGERKIDSTTIHGVESNGMICSEAELGIGEDQSGILVLEDPNLKPGQSITEALCLDDWILEIGVTPNRPDCLSVLGIAREIAALYDLEISRKDPFGINPGEEASTTVPITIEAPDLCYRYTAAVLDNVSIGPSPVWMQRRLEACGIRSINNVVDITNYILLETGQPLHAFDLDKLKGPAIIVRTAKPGESIMTLDGKDRKLDPDMLVIADQEDAVAVAGIMGGADSEVTDDTRRILLESAWFAPSQVRRTAKRLKLSTDASYRFERGIDPEMVTGALFRAMELVTKIAGGKVCGNHIDVYPRPYSPVAVSIRPQRANQLLGTSISAKDISDIVRRVGVQITEEDDDVIKGFSPSHRPDIVSEIDLVEEVARLHGFAKIPTLLPKAELITTGATRIDATISKIKTILMAQGMSEAISYSFLAEKEVKALKFPDESPHLRMVRLKNPLSDDQAVLRTHLFSSLLGACARNQARRNLDIRLFEVGKIFFATKPGHQPQEEMRLSAILAGPRHPDLWCWPSEQSDLFDLKGIMEMLLNGMGISGWHIELGTPDAPYYLPGSSGRIVHGDENSLLGTFGQISSDVLEQWDIEVPVFGFDFSVEKLSSASNTQVKFRPLPEFPSVERDVAIVLPEDVAAQDILDFIEKQNVTYLESLKIFDLYRGKPIPKNFKSLGLRLRYRATDHTLSDEEVSQVHDPVIKALMEHFKGELRS